MERERRLAGGLGSVDLHDSAARHAADAEGEVERERARADGFDVHGAVIITEAHHGAAAKGLFDLRKGGLQRLLAILGLHLRGRGCAGGFLLICHSVDDSFYI